VARDGLRARIEAALAAGDAHTRWGAAFALARGAAVGSAVLGACVEALGAADGDVRWAAAEIVCNAARADSSITQQLADAAASPSPERRKMALYCLRDVGSRNAALFAAGLADADRGVRLAAISALARCASLDAPAAVRVAAALRAERDEGVRRAAAATLAGLGGQHADIEAALATLVSNDARTALPAGAAGRVATPDSAEPPQAAPISRGRRDDRRRSS
jgi:HEAT repeat protein